MLPTQQPMPHETVVYLSGPMTGMPNWGFDQFDEYAARLRNIGYRVLNPADFGANPKYTWADCLQRDLMVLGYADLVAVLPGAYASKGATLERHVAEKLGKRVVPVEDLI